MLHKWTNTPWDELWMRPVEILTEEAICCYREHFELIRGDLLSLPGPRSTLVEGTCLLPDLVCQELTDRHQGIWLVPTEAFQRQHYPERGNWVNHILRQCRHPDRALQNWMDRDAEFAQWVITTTARLRLESIVVDGSHTVEETAQQVARCLRLADRN